MSQQINLYQPALFDKRVPFSSRMMAAAMAVALVLALSAGAAGRWRLAALETELAGLQERHDAATQRVEDYQGRFSARTPDSDLARKVENMLGDRQARLALLKLLTQGQPGNSRGFSRHLEGLAREKLATVWLRRIRLQAGGGQLLLEGSTTSAADVPLYLQRLTGQPDYAGCEFEQLRLSRSETNPQLVDFLLQTTHEEKP
jgi:Tfp pilus assembly protein PilN